MTISHISLITNPELNLDQDDLPTERALELKWNCKTDLLKLIVKGAKVSLTRRQLLCELASIFDPLGFHSPNSLTDETNAAGAYT